MRVRLQLGCVVLAACAVSESAPLDLDRDPAACAACHPAQQLAWRASRHAKSFVDGAFHAELEPRRPAWCVGCHAPLVPDPGHVRDDDPLARTGVGCVACHLRAGQLVSATRAPSSPHATRPDPSFGSPAWCASCHQFNFPVLDDGGRAIRETAYAMQATIAQAQAAGVATGCLDCHDAHRANGSHELEMLHRALTVAICADEQGLRVGVTNAGAGHNVPTGGIDRYMVLRVWRSLAPERLVTTRFGRTFRGAVGGGKQTVADTTLAAGATSWTLAPSAALGGSAVDPINVELRYSYAADERARLPDTDVAITIARERIAWSAVAPCSLPLERYEIANE
jgi:hypothetical protein